MVSPQRVNFSFKVRFLPTLKCRGRILIVEQKKIWHNILKNSTLSGNLLAQINFAVVSQINVRVHLMINNNNLITYIVQVFIKMIKCELHW